MALGALPGGPLRPGGSRRRPRGALRPRGAGALTTGALGASRPPLLDLGPARRGTGQVGGAEAGLSFDGGPEPGAHLLQVLRFLGEGLPELGGELALPELLGHVGDDRPAVVVG